MDLASNTKYRVSRNPAATQIILLCHGGWSNRDGTVRVRKGMTIKFYSAHGNFATQSQSIAQQLLGSATAAPAISMQEALAMEARGEDPFAAQEANTGGLPEVVQECKRTQGKAYNYSLSYSGPRASEADVEALFELHQEGGLDSDIDLMVMIKGASAHLKSAMKFAGDYAVFHFLPCRYVDAEDAKSMKTVHLPDFGGEDFIETSVL